MQFEFSFKYLSPIEKPILMNINVKKKIKHCKIFHTFFYRTINIISTIIEIIEKNIGYFLINHSKKMFFLETTLD